tara:strand:+ start:1035 stop:1481 length:447 start_codon:yes stop_codon:yes gene_type:complete
MKKKGFFFSLDAFFAIMIFTIILVSVYGYFINVQELRQQYFYSEDTLDIFINTKMEEVTYIDEHYNLNLLDEWGLIDSDLTIMDQIIKLNDQGYPNYSQWIFYNLTSDFFGEKYGTGFRIGLTDIFESDKNVTALVARQRYVSGTQIV